MMRLLVVVVLIAWCAPVWAREFSAPTPIRPYEPISITGDLKTVAEYYGTLAGDPVMYELVVRDSGVLELTLDQPQTAPTPLPLQMLLVRSVAGGRFELVLRSDVSPERWETYTEHGIGMRWWRTAVTLPELPPGIYSIEVSSAQNQGDYRLTVGGGASHDSYVGAWRRLWFVHTYYERSWWQLFGSGMVLGHSLLLGVVGLLWYCRVRLQRWVRAGIERGRLLLPSRESA
jgi:hypothetical protein